MCEVRPPATDAFLVLPGAMQTILISASSICREPQGVVVHTGWLRAVVEDHNARPVARPGDRIVG